MNNISIKNNSTPVLIAKLFQLSRLPQCWKEENILKEDKQAQQAWEETHLIASGQKGQMPKQNTQKKIHIWSTCNVHFYILMAYYTGTPLRNILTLPEHAALYIEVTQRLLKSQRLFF